MIYNAIFKWHGFSLNILLFGLETCKCIHPSIATLWSLSLTLSWRLQNISKSKHEKSLHAVFIHTYIWECNQTLCQKPPPVALDDSHPQSGLETFSLPLQLLPPISEPKQTDSRRKAVATKYRFLLVKASMNFFRVSLIRVGIKVRLLQVMMTSQAEQCLQPSMYVSGQWVRVSIDFTYSTMFHSDSIANFTALPDAYLIMYCMVFACRITHD